MAETFRLRIYNKLPKIIFVENLDVTKPLFERVFFGYKLIFCRKDREDLHKLFWYIQGAGWSLDFCMIIQTGGWADPEEQSWAFAMVDPFFRFNMVPAKGKQPGEGGLHQPAEQVPSIQADVSHPQLNRIF